METHLKRSLKLLTQYLKDTPKEVIEKELSYYAHLDYEGVSFKEYIELFSMAYKKLGSLR